MGPKRIIKKVAVLGSGVMGSRIACHFANIGLQVLLLDMVSKDASNDPKSKNKLVNEALAAALKSNPSPVYKFFFPLTKKVKFASLETTKTVDNLKEWMKILFAAKDKAGDFYRGNYISEHDVKISQKLAYVIAGGDLSQPTLGEDYLLDLEPEAFISLCAERKSLERIQSILTGGKVLRN